MLFWEFDIAATGRPGIYQFKNRKPGFEYPLRVINSYRKLTVIKICAKRAWRCFYFHISNNNRVLLGTIRCRDSGGLLHRFEIQKFFSRDEKKATSYYHRSSRIAFFVKRCMDALPVRSPREGKGWGWRGRMVPQAGRILKNKKECVAAHKIQRSASRCQVPMICVKFI